jgi:hypothetical protein
MKIKWTILNAAGLIQIGYALGFYLIKSRHNDPEGCGMLVTIILVAFGVAAIIIDLILQKLVKNRRLLLFIEAALIIIGWFLIYRS